MRLFLVRHGESVDNVAGLYAGSRDSYLTSHGVLQTQRLGAHLAGRSRSIGRITHIFSSDLQRASRTADAILAAQDGIASVTERDALQVVTLMDLRERDFRSSEGMRFGGRAGASGKPVHLDAESRDEMQARIDRFLDSHLLAVLQTTSREPEKVSVVIVAHGIILNVLLRTLLSRFAPAEQLRLETQGDRAARAEYLASWSNTGYLEADIAASEPLQSAGAESSDCDAGSIDSKSPQSTSPSAPLYLSVLSVNNTDHLRGLKKTRGGIGSAKFDAKQKTMDSFFGPAAKKLKHNPDSDG